MISKRRVCLFVVAVVMALGGWTPARPAAQERPALSARAQAAIAALLQEKESRTPAERKIDSRLLYAFKLAAGQPVPDGLPRTIRGIPYAPDGHVIVDIRGQITDAAVTAMRGRGHEVLSVDRGRSRARLHVAIERVLELAEMPDVTFIQPQEQAITSRQTPETNLVLKMGGVGSARSEGDVAHLAHAARKAFGVDGTGVKIGVLSDGVSNLATSQAAGDLGAVTVLAGQAGSGDEGTAMLEIVHDLAPGAQLYFATAFSGIASFANNIRALRTAGCQIIVDDVFYFVESPFQDGETVAQPSVYGSALIQQAVNDVVASGALYFSSAGNSGNLSAGTSGTWEGDFALHSAAGPPFSGYSYHNFSGFPDNVLEVNGFGTNLYWSDPLGASGNDYDLVAFDGAGNILDWSLNVQNGNDDPYEQMGSAIGDYIAILKKNSAAARFLHLSTIRGELEFSTAGEIHGHAQAAGAFAVAATPALNGFPNGFSAANNIEWFSSDGPRRVFFQPNRTPYTPGNLSSTGGVLRQKPDITAADGIRVTGVGDFPGRFYGTSASAPHAAAIAGLLLSKDPTLTVAQVRTALTAGSIDIAAAGVDRDSGSGIVMADGALRAITPASAALAPKYISAFDNPGNGNATPEAGEGAYVSVELGNFGGAQATAISATVTSSTPGISITQPSNSTYPNLLTSATSFGNVPFYFTVASNFPCPQSAAFTMTVNYAGGAGPQVFNFDVPIGPPPFTIFETLGGAPPPPLPAPGVSAAAGTQDRRLNITHVPSVCGVSKPMPGLFVEAPTARAFDAYTFNTCPGTGPSCVTVTMEANSNLFSAAYAPTFDPANVTSNYKADLGSSGGPRSYAFNLAPGAQMFAVDVHEVAVLPPSSSRAYSLTVEGACGGTCAPPNQVPVAKAKNVTVNENPAGTYVSVDDIDDGSFDPDAGDTLFRSLDNYGPFPLGPTTVTLTVTDPKGATSQASAIVTVTNQPTLSINDVSINEGNAGTVNANFQITLSAPSSQQVFVWAYTTDQSATFEDYFGKSESIQFLPGEVSKTFTVSVKSNAVLEPDETFAVNLDFPSNATIADAQGIGTILNDDQALTEARVTQAVANGSARLQQLQRPDGGWFFKVGDTQCGGSAVVSCLNTVGITGLGLLAGHTRETDPVVQANLLADAVEAGDFLVARYNATVASVPPVLPASQDVEFLVELGAKTGNAVYTTTATNWFARITSNYTAEQYVDKLIADRGKFAPVGVWNVGSLIRSAKAVLNTPYAEAAALHVTSPAVEALWKDVDPSHRFDQCGNPGGCGAPDNPFGYDYTLIAMGTLLNGVHDLAGFPFAKSAEYLNHLLSQQYHDGSWDVGDVQITSYVVLGLAAFDAPPAVLDPAVAWLVAHQQGNGGWPAYATFGALGSEYSEVDAEVVRAIFTLFNTPEGEGVMVAPAQLSTLTFSEVTESGRTSVVAAALPAGTETAPGVELLKNLTYDVTTTASFSGQTTVCFAVPSVTTAAEFARVRLLHREGNVLVDRTILASGVNAPNFEKRRVCGEVSSLSPFAIGVRDITPPTATITLSPSLIAADAKNIVSVTASIDVSDNTDPSPTVTLISITSSEPDKGLGKGDNPNDIQSANVGTDDREFRVRAENFSGPAGRTYTVVYRLADRYGNSRDVSSQVIVR